MICANIYRSVPGQAFTSADWRDLAGEFRALAEQRSGKTLRARWACSAASRPMREWTLRATGRHWLANAVKVEFEALAQHGGIGIDPSPESHYTWLEALLEYTPQGEGAQTTQIAGDARSRFGMIPRVSFAIILLRNWLKSFLDVLIIPRAGTRTSKIAEDGHDRFGAISDVCNASASLCKVFEASAIEAERAAEQEKQQKRDPRTWSEERQRMEAFSEIRKQMSRTPKEIPEECLRDILGRRHGIKPEVVTLRQMKESIVELLPDSPVIGVIPSRLRAAGDRSLSKRDLRVHDAVGQNNFCALTNAEIARDRAIMERLRATLKRGEAASRMLKSPEAVKSCFDRIRRAKGYPLSREIAKKRSSRN